MDSDHMNSEHLFDLLNIAAGREYYDQHRYQWLATKGLIAPVDGSGEYKPTYRGMAAIDAACKAADRE